MNNKLFTFLDPLLGYIDNGRFFREPFRRLSIHTPNRAMQRLSRSLSCFLEPMCGYLPM
jgi:hypothetical protein